MPENLHRRATDEAEDIQQNNRLSDLEDAVKRIEGLLVPISETYSTVTTLGKWAMALLVFASVIIGIILGFIKLFNGKA